MAITLILLSLLFIRPIFASNDITINCSPSSCDVAENLPLFSETKIYPGFSSSQNLTVNNNRSGDCYLALKFQNNQEIVSQLSDAILITIDSNSQTLSSLLNSNQLLSLGTMPKNTSKSIILQSQFNYLFDNQYQGLTQNFDIDLNFECEDEVPLAPNSSPSDSSSSHQATTDSTLTSVSTLPDTTGSVLGDMDAPLFTSQAEFSDDITDNSPFETQPVDTDGQVAGTTTCARHWLPLLFLPVFILNTLYLRRSKKIILPLIASSLAYATDRLLLETSCCQINILCRYYFIGHMLSFLLPCYLVMRKNRLAETNK